MSAYENKSQKKFPIRLGTISQNKKASQAFRVYISK